MRVTVRTKSEQHEFDCTLAYHLPDPLVAIYHNITPAEFFLGFHPHLAGLCHHGRRELEAFAPRTALGLGDSEYNRRELEAAGFEVSTAAGGGDWGHSPARNATMDSVSCAMAGVYTPSRDFAARPIWYTIEA